MKYTTNPVIVDAWQFIPDGDLKPPKWIVDAYKANVIRITLSEQYGNYVSVDYKEIYSKAFAGDWLIRNEYGHIEVVKDEVFRVKYRRAE